MAETKTAAKAGRKKPKQITDDDHKQVVDLIRGRCLEMSFTVHGLPKSRRITGAMADQLAASVRGKKKGVRASWSMFTSEHPAVKEVLANERRIYDLRDAYTIVRSAEAKKGADEKVTIAAGKRLIWDKDVEEFHGLIVRAAKLLDRAYEKLQYAMDNETSDADGNPVKSVKDMDRANAGDAWSPDPYPPDVTKSGGLAKERNHDGSAKLDENGDPVYVINFAEYHVSEKLPKLLQDRAIARIDAGISSSVETAVNYTVAELSDGMMTFLGQLSNRTKVYPRANSPFAYLVARGDAEVVKRVTHADDSKVPAGHVKVLVRYAAEQDGGEVKVSKWLGPLKDADYHTQLNPQETGEKRKLFPSVIEGIVAQLENFKARKARMLGAYGDNLVTAFEPLLEALTRAKRQNPFLSADDSAKKLVAALKTSDGLKEQLARDITDAVEALEEQVTVVKESARRRSIKAGMIGAFSDD